MNGCDDTAWTPHYFPITVFVFRSGDQKERHRSRPCCNGLAGFLLTVVAALHLAKAPATEIGMEEANHRHVVRWKLSRIDVSYCKVFPSQGSHEKKIEIFLGDSSFHAKEMSIEVVGHT